MREWTEFEKRMMIEAMQELAEEGLMHFDRDTTTKKITEKGIKHILKILMLEVQLAREHRSLWMNP